MNTRRVGLDTADRHEPATAQARSVRLNEKIAAMKSQLATLKEIEAKLDATGETQISLTDPDARSMITRGSGIVGYNVQTAVDAKHHLQDFLRTYKALLKPPSRA